MLAARSLSVVRWGWSLPSSRLLGAQFSVIEFLTLASRKGCLLAKAGRKEGPSGGRHLPRLCGHHPNIVITIISLLATSGGPLQKVQLGALQCCPHLPDATHRSLPRPTVSVITGYCDNVIDRFPTAPPFLLVGLSFVLSLRFLKLLRGWLARILDVRSRSPPGQIQNFVFVLVTSCFLVSAE